jgi:predicted membrane channel-forming protein YqfA (hemolysin III family)
MKKTTWQGWLFLAAWVLIIAAAVLFGISEYTTDAKLGQLQENWSIGIFVTGLLTLLVSRASA